MTNRVASKSRKVEPFSSSSSVASPMLAKPFDAPTTLREAPIEDLVPLGERLVGDCGLPWRRDAPGRRRSRPGKESPSFTDNAAGERNQALAPLPIRASLAFA